MCFKFFLIEFLNFEVFGLQILQKKFALCVSFQLTPEFWIWISTIILIKTQNNQ